MVFQVIFVDLHLNVNQNLDSVLAFSIWFHYGAVLLL